MCPIMKVWRYVWSKTPGKIPLGRVWRRKKEEYPLHWAKGSYSRKETMRPLTRRFQLRTDLLTTLPQRNQCGGMLLTKKAGSKTQNKASWKNQTPWRTNKVTDHMLRDMTFHEVKIRMLLEIKNKTRIERFKKYKVEQRKIKMREEKY